LLSDEVMVVGGDDDAKAQIVSSASALVTIDRFASNRFPSPRKRHRSSGPYLIWPSRRSRPNFF
jgi:hypothetical protein